MYNNDFDREIDFNTISEDIREMVHNFLSGYTREVSSYSVYPEIRNDFNNCQFLENITGDYLILDNYSGLIIGIYNLSNDEVIYNQYYLDYTNKINKELFDNSNILSKISNFIRGLFINH